MERQGATDIHRFGWPRRAAERLIALAGRVGADPLESSDASLQRRLLVLMSVGTLPLTVLWSVTYFSAGRPSPPRLLRFIRSSPRSIQLCLAGRATSASTASPSAHSTEAERPFHGKLSSHSARS